MATNLQCTTSCHSMPPYFSLKSRSNYMAHLVMERPHLNPQPVSPSPVFRLATAHHTAGGEGATCSLVAECPHTPTCLCLQSTLTLCPLPCQASPTVFPRSQTHHTAWKKGNTHAPASPRPSTFSPCLTSLSYCPHCFHETTRQE